MPTHEIDRICARYLAAMDAGDWDAVLAIWSAAETDPELEAALHEMDEGIATEGLT